MLSHIFKTTLSHLRKNKYYASLNILGLSLGIASVFLIYLFLRNELSFDKHFAHASSIHRIGVEYTFDGKVDQFANAPRPMAQTLGNELPQVIAQTRISGVNGLFTHRALFNLDERIVKSEKVFYADSTFFQVFSYDFAAGDPATALARPNSLVVTESLAARLFGKTDVLGKNLKLDNSLAVQITGILKDDFRPTHLPVEALVSWTHDARPGEMDRWIGWHVYTYVRLNKNSSREALDAQLPAIYEKFMEPTFKQFGGTARILTQPLTGIHLESDLQWEAYANGDKTNIYVFFTVSAFIILLVAINYTNLTTAKALERFREIGIRKILGSSRKLIFVQLVADSLITSLIATIIGIFLITLLLPTFSQITGLTLDYGIFSNPLNILVLVSLFLFTSLISSLYPAIYISKFRPISAVGGRYASGKTRVRNRKVLVGIQFFIAVTLLFATATVIRQSAFMQSKSLGFDRDNTLVIQVRGAEQQGQLSSIENGLMAIPGVSSAAATKSYPGQPLVQGMLDIKELDGSYTSTGLEFMESSLEFPETIGMEVLAGRTFDETFVTDLEQAILINETGAKLLGGTEAAIGRQISAGTDSLGNPIDYDIVGVVRDFHTISLHVSIQPIVIFPTQENNAILIRTDGENDQALLERLETYWENLNSGFPFEYTFLNDDFVSLHNKEADLQRLLTYFSLLIVFISCLGLLGLISYTTKRRARELTIRKVIGSSDSSLIGLMLSGQLPPVLVALVIAIPTAWYFMNQWLNDFAYHTSVQWTQAALVTLVTIILALLTMTYHVIKAAKTSPAEVLRQE